MCCPGRTRIDGRDEDGSQRMLIAERATTCLGCPVAVRGGSGTHPLDAVACSAELTLAGRPVPAGAYKAGHPCPLGKGIDRGAALDDDPIQRWPAPKRKDGTPSAWARLGLSVRWHGVAYPLRLFAFVVAPSHPRPGTLPIVGRPAGRAVAWMARRRVLGRRLWPRRLRWMVRVGSANARLPGCGCVVWLKAVVERAKESPRIWIRGLGSAVRRRRTA